VFQSATIKLTLWYVGILVTISLIFSIIIFSIASSEVGSRINYLQRSAGTDYNLDPTRYDDMRNMQVQQARVNLIGSLVITNVCIWFAGGIGSYYLARRTLLPIENAHEAQSRFTSDASHELRTPLASMKVELEVALRDPKLSKDDIRQLLASNLEEVNKLTKLSHTLLQLSRLDHAGIDHEPVLLNSAIATVLARFQSSRQRIIYTDLPPVSVMANQSHIEELLTIFIDNALKYSPNNSPVTLTLVQQKQLSGFDITNTGKGIPAEELPRIFDRFYRSDTSRTSGAKKGYGLGLSLAKKIVELHGGELTVSSQPEQFTTFRILLPNVS
jgi:signal transduction histidine kinase